MEKKSDNDVKDSLWEVLGHAPKAVPGPFFTQQVLQKVRDQRQSSERVLIGWLFYGKAAWTLAGAAVVMTVISLSIMFRPHDAPIGTAIHQAANAQHLTTVPVFDEDAAIDYLLIANLDDILAAEEQDLWAEFAVN